MKNFYRMQVYDSIICGYFGIGFISFMFKMKTLTGFTDLLLSHDITQPFGSRIKKWMERMCVIAKGALLPLKIPPQFRLSKMKEIEVF